MKNSLRRFLYALLIAIFISGNLFQGISAGSQPDNPTPEIGHNPETGRVSFIGGGSPITIPGASGIRALSAQDKAQVAAEIYGPQFGLKNPSQELTLNKTTNDGNGHAITRYQQVYQGIPVLGGELIFNMNSNGDLLSASGEVSSDLSLDTQPAISGEAAAKSALGAVAKWHEIDASSLILSKPELMIFDESLLKESSRAPQLVWHLEVTAAGQPIREMVLIDAQTGSISLHINQIDTIGAVETDPQDLKPAFDTFTLNTSSTPSAIAGFKAAGGASTSSEPSQNLNTSPATWYVSTTGNDSNSCSAVGATCATIDGALGKAAAGDNIKVAVGTYTGSGPTPTGPVVAITKSIQILGGWDAAFAIQNGHSIIDGQNGGFGIWISFPVTVVLDRFVIQNFTTEGGGGGISLFGSRLTLQNSTLKSNHAGNYGGGIFVWDHAILTLVNSTLSGNSAGFGGGGGIYIDIGSTAIIQNSTIAYNSSNSGSGGGIRLVDGSIEMHNSILAPNTATGSGPDCSGTITASDHNIIGTTSGCTVSAGTGDQFNVDPLIAALGGTPPVHALQAGSPAINAGDNSICPVVDERGVIRPQNGTCDIGAYEFTSTPTGTAFAIDVFSGSPQVTIISTAFGNPFNAVVTDQYGLPVANVTVTFTAPSSGASGTFADTGTNTTSAVTNASGLATASIFTANATTGSYTVVATAVGLAAPAQFQLQNGDVPAPATITVGSGSPQSSPINLTFASPLKALVKDQYNNPVSGITVTFTAPSSGASGRFADSGNNITTAVTDSNGIASAATFTANATTGSYTVVATVAGPATPAQFQLQNSGAPAPTTITVSSGSPQSSLINSTFTSPLKALIKDQYNNPMSGVTVTFTAPSSSASGTFTDTGTNTTSAVTNVSGLATASTFTANATIGDYTVNATSTGIVSPASFQLTNQWNPWYVSTTGNDSNDCQTPATPCAMINSTIAKAPTGAEIRVATGTYTGSGTYVVTITKSIQILGGWDAAFTTRTGQSIIDSQASRSGIYIHGTGLAVELSQVRVQNAGAGGYVAVYDDNTGGTVNFTRIALVNNNGNGLSNFNGNVNFINSTISGNHSISTSSSAIYNGNGNINIQFSTITNNTGYTSIYSLAGSAQIEMGNSILAGNTITDCVANITSDGHNIFGSSRVCEMGHVNLQPSDKVGVNPQISLLTPGGYHALLPGSPAIDAADPAACPAVDQRGIVRPYPVAGACDIGAYEVIPAGLSAIIFASGGSGQAAGLNLPLPGPLLAFVGDSNGTPVSGATVTFTAPAFGASGAFSDSGTNTTTAVTNNGGIATVTTFIANAVAGTYNITATTPGAADAANFSITNQEFYVAPTGNDVSDCLTPGTACLTINGAIAKAPVGAGIRIAIGTYTGTATYVMTIDKNLNISGGWNPAFTSQTGYSIIDGQNARLGIRVNDGMSAVIDHLIVQNCTQGLYIHYATLILNNSIVQNNSGPGLSAGIDSEGSSLTINNSTINSNISQGPYSGAGIYIAEGTATINNSTVWGNAGTTTSHNVDAGGIYNYNGKLTINNSTIVKNSGDVSGGINTYIGTDTVIHNSIIANNTTTSLSPSDCNILTSADYNIIGNITGCSVAPGAHDQFGVNPILSPAASGSPSYFTLLAGSPAIEAGDPANCSGTDERGVSRPQGSVCDIGAIESQPGTTVASIHLFRGSPQNIKIGAAASPAFSVAAADASGIAVQGITVTFTAPLSGATGIFSGSGTNTTTAVTGFNGIATAAFTANSTYGSYSLQATVSGLSTPVVFSVTNISLVYILTYTLNHGPGPLPGVFVCNLTQPACTNGIDPDVNHATQYAYDTFLFYKNHFQRDSIDNAGLPLISSVHFGTNYKTAFWNGYQMVYGDGYPADDVVGHELTHGVTDYTSQLIYAYQAGAINESLSDIFGEFIDQTDGAGNDSAGVKWLIGEDLPRGAIRSMSNPPAFGDPDTMTSLLFDSRHGGSFAIYKNSGVNNKAAFLMTDGGSFNGRAITGIGLNKTAAIYYEVQTNLLGAGANYSDLYYALNQACLNLVGGSDGITLGDCDQVKNAIDAVEMNVKPSQVYTPNPDACAAGESVTSTLFSDDMESGTGKWIFGPVNVISDKWSFQTPGIASPYHSLVHVDQPIPSDSFAEMNADIPIPLTGKPLLYFKHYFDFDSYYDVNGYLRFAYDGGVLEYSTNHGATWADAAPLFDAGQNYNAVIFNDIFNPLAVRPAFSGFSDQMVGSRYNLASLAGKTVRFRWREGTDETIGAEGWYVDDIKVYTCASVALPVISGNTGVAGATLSYIDTTHKTVTTDNYGNYSFPVSYNWSGTVTLSHACYTFNPVNLSYTNVIINQTAQDYIHTLNPGCANINVSIGGNHQGTYGLPPAGSVRVNYSGVDNGPVQVASTNSVPIIAAVRDAWAANGTTTSFTQLMGLPAGQLSDTYVFPAYNNVTLNEQLRIGNVDSVPTTVTVTIGGVLRGTYPLAASQAVRVNYAGLDSGPVIVQGTAGVRIIAAERDAWTANGTITSFTQLMGLPAGQLSDNYVFPAYNNVTLNEQLRIGNVDSVPTTVTVTIGGVLRGTYPLNANEAVRVNYAGLDSGPVIVQGTAGVHIIAAIRDAWAAVAPYNTTTSFAQLMGLPSGQLSDTYEFPAYNNVTLNEQLRIGNVDSLPTTVTVTIGGVLRGTYPLAANEAVRVNYAGLDSGPVVVQGTSGVHIIAAIRDAWAANGVTTSFTQLMGLPAGSLSDTFLFPAYNNVTLNEQLRFGVP